MIVVIILVSYTNFRKWNNQINISMSMYFISKRTADTIIQITKYYNVI